MRYARNDTLLFLPLILYIPFSLSPTIYYMHSLRCIGCSGRKPFLFLIQRLISDFNLSVEWRCYLDAGYYRLRLDHIRSPFFFFSLSEYQTVQNFSFFFSLKKRRAQPARVGLDFLFFFTRFLIPRSFVSRA